MRGFKFVSREQLNKDVQKEINFNSIIPKRGTKESAGYDFYAPFNITIAPKEEIKIPTGIRAYMNKGEMLLLFPRSSLGFKYYCRLANTVGVIDSDYYNSDNEGHIWVKLRNEGDKAMFIKSGEGICQGVFIPFLLTDNDSFDVGNVRNGGIGSTSQLT